jgi:inner membrane protein
MFISHIPAGYIISRFLVRHVAVHGISIVAFLRAGVVGALVPDFDMLYFYLVDHRQHHHHTYVTHYPVVWLFLLFVSLIWLFLARTKNHAACAAIFSLNGLAHISFDTIVGDIWWLAPWVDKPFALFTVPALYKPWWLSFLLHWSFALEIAVLLWALYLWRKGRLEGHP